MGNMNDNFLSGLNLFKSTIEAPVMSILNKAGG